MKKTTSTLTVFFDSPFWVGVCEREYDGAYEVCRILFGSEPKDYEIYGFMIENYDSLNFSPSLDSAPTVQRRINPKRMQREINKQLQKNGVGTKAQQALKVQQEQGKAERKARSRQLRNEERENQFKLRQAKRKEKHRGH